MANNDNKTKPTKVSTANFIKTLPPKSQPDAKALVKIFKDVTGWKPVMWGNIFGFGLYHYKYDSGREGDFLATGFAMRQSGPVLYIMPGYQDYEVLMKKLGPHKLGKSCLYLKRLSDVDEKVLRQLIKLGVKDLKKIYPVSKS